MREHSATFNEALRSIGAHVRAGIGLAVSLEESLSMEVVRRQPHTVAGAALALAPGAAPVFPFNLPRCGLRSAPAGTLDAGDCRALSG